jgi:hypothetical protein
MRREREPQGVPLAYRASSGQTSFGGRVIRRTNAGIRAAALYSRLSAYRLSRRVGMPGS